MFPVSALPLSRTPRRKTSCSAASFRWWTSCRTFWLRRTLPTVWIPWLLKTRAVSRQRIGVAAGLSGEDRRVSVRSPIWLMGRRRPSVARGQSSRPPSLMFLFLVAHSGQKAIAAKEQWKELKATYRENVEAIKIALTKSLTQMEEAQKKRTQLQEAFEQLQAKKQMAMEKRRAAQEQWQLQQGKLLFPEAAAEAENILDDKPQQLARPEEHSIGDIMERDPGVSSKADGLQPALDSNLPWLPGGQQHGERS
ncbi:ZW10 interactor isoform X5 [Sapajus apella]|uniref:ZW10 interactor isoform X5 n=1 Tax=Sapajus apella TaxID=9515 RepID=A0A6J3F7H1_SAPAP|nr:ZW10 interactor isoform X5 [Sapajus apella]